MASADDRTAETYIVAFENLTVAKLQADTGRIVWSDATKTTVLRDGVIKKYSAKNLPTVLVFVELGRLVGVPTNYGTPAYESCMKRLLSLICTRLSEKNLWPALRESEDQCVWADFLEEEARKDTFTWRTITPTWLRAPERTRPTTSAVSEVVCNRMRRTQLLREAVSYMVSNRLFCRTEVSPLLHIEPEEQNPGEARQETGEVPLKTVQRFADNAHKQILHVYARPKTLRTRTAEEARTARAKLDREKARVVQLKKELIAERLGREEDAAAGMLELERERRGIARLRDALMELQIIDEAQKGRLESYDRAIDDSIDHVLGGGASALRTRQCEGTIPVGEDGWERAQVEECDAEASKARKLAEGLEAERREYDDKHASMATERDELMAELKSGEGEGGRGQGAARHRGQEPRFVSPVGEVIVRHLHAGI
ncbi:hypothetical protein LTR08_001346 [Meristemomyces frigidus]|nr:hypothetical protein LTR08_001346 [Meristemomyces frigidus]